MHSRKSAETGVEGEALLVPGRSRRSDDRSGYPAVLGATDGCADSIGKDRSRTLGYRTRVGRRNNPSGCNKCDTSPKYVVRHATVPLSSRPFRRTPLSWLSTRLQEQG